MDKKEYIVHEHRLSEVSGQQLTQLFNGASKAGYDLHSVHTQNGSMYVIWKNKKGE